jgi:eukaryotic-like serine/threonine-protein kinase
MAPHVPRLSGLHSPMDKTVRATSDARHTVDAIAASNPNSNSTEATNARYAEISSVRPSAPDVELATLRPGDRIAGRYVVEGVLGVGGMAYVIAARHEELDERVAIKFLRPDAAANPEVVARFAREARACVRIKSEHVARVFDVGTLDGGTPFIVMEHLEGQDLGAILRDRGMLDIPGSALLAMQACEALAAAHANGVIHRDVKPENLFVTTRDDGTPILKVLDFGISKVALTGSAFGIDLELVKTMSLMGSPLYMSPEQIRATRDVDHRTDIWSLGVVLYELLTGRNVFNGASITELSAMILEADPEPLRTHRPDVPLELEQIVLRTLEKDPQRRYQNVAELSAALVRFAPRRARVSAERTSAVLVKAGLSEPTTPFPSTVPPPPKMPHGMAFGPESSRFPSRPHAPSLSTSHTSLSNLALPRAAMGTHVIVAPHRRWPFALGSVVVVSLVVASLAAGVQFGRANPVVLKEAPERALLTGSKLGGVAASAGPADIPYEAPAVTAGAPSLALAPAADPLADAGSLVAPARSIGASPSAAPRPPAKRSPRKTRHANDDEPDLGF